MRRATLAAWSVVAWTVAFGVMGLVTILMLPFAMLGLFHRVQRLGPMQIVGLIPHLTLSRLTVTRDPGFDPTRVSVYMQNHISMLDAHVAIRAIETPFCGVENATHLRVPFYGWLMRMANAIPVRPGGTNRTSELTEAARERASRGISVLAFPEGTRTRTGALGAYKTGAFFMARDAGLPVVPVAVRGFFEVLPKGSWIVTPGHIEVLLGPTLDTEGLDDDGVRALAERCREVTEEWLAG